MKELSEQLIETMLSEARQAREMAYAPYSKFRVGACLLAGDGQLYSGCNIENAAYTPTNCAERTAMFTAVSRGERDFRAIAVVWDGSGYAMPCGVCRQVLCEFCRQDMPVICGKNDGSYRVMLLSELMPGAFLPGDLGV